MKKFKQTELHFDSKELKTDLGTGNFIFVGSSCDMFAEDIPDKWILDTLEHCNKFNNTYLFQTKNPERFEEFSGKYPPRSIFGTTIETNRENDLANCPRRDLRASWMCASFLVDKRKMVTIEPIMEFDMEVLVKWIKLIKPEFINVGADSTNSGLPEPEADKIRELISQLSGITKVNVKFNLHRILKKKRKVVKKSETCLYCGTPIELPKQHFCSYAHDFLYSKEKKKIKNGKKQVSKVQ
jgi:predicted nucleic acid-binding Zn ribbon protein